MKHLRIPVGVALALAILISGAAFAQGTQRGTLRGTVKLGDGSAVPGVLVTASSPDMLGVQTTSTSETGNWILRNLNPGTYTVIFELEGMATVQSAATVELGQGTPVDVTMQVAAQEETIIVTGELASVLADSQVSTTYSFEDVNNLPIRNRTPTAIADMAPGLTTNTPNGGQVTISGGFAYDNVWLIDGVDANDNLFGTPTTVYIEDAIADIQVLTSGISAEYGRFSGGVVNIVTKSGGNDFSGTLRADLSNDDWRETTPREEELGTELGDELSEIYSATLGGYILKDRLWFFLAGRDRETAQTLSFKFTGLPRPSNVTEDRQEIKGTVNILDKHQVQAQYTEKNQDTLRASSGGGSATPSTVDLWATPSDLTVARYSGVWSPSLFGEIQYSEKTFLFQINQSQSPPFDISADSPIWDDFGSLGVHYNSPHWDGSDPEDRNNEQLAGAVSFFLDSASAGSHDLKLGFEDITTTRTGGNSQSPTDFQLIANPLLDGAGNGVLTPDDDLTPVWESWNSGAWQFFTNRDAQVDTTTQSFYVNDRWQLNDHWSFNIGARYEEVSGDTTSGIVIVDTDALVPRLGASYDVRGDGKYRFDLTYAEYAGKYSESQFAENTDVGNPPGILRLYTGPDCVGRVDVCPEAYDFASGDYHITIAADDGTQNVFQDPNITSPTVDEITFGAGMELKRGGFLKVVYTDRSYSDFVEDFTTLADGPCGQLGFPCTAEVVVSGASAGTFSSNVITNTNVPSREYQAVQAIARYRLTDNWTVEGNWTYQLKNDGNFEGEGTNTPGSSSNFGDYPEITPNNRYLPVGKLNDFAEHKVRAWTNYNWDVGRAGNLNFGLLMNFDSGLTRSRSSNVSVRPEQQAILDSLGYVDGPSSRTIYYNGRRGDVNFDDALTFDLSVNYQLPIWKDLALWIKTDITNLLDDDTQIDGENGVSPNFGGPTDAFGLPTTYTETSNFRRGTSNADFVLPREYRFTVGFRF